MTACIGGLRTTSRRKGMHTLKLTLTVKAGNNESLNTLHVSLTKDHPCGGIAISGVHVLLLLVVRPTVL